MIRQRRNPIEVAKELAAAREMPFNAYGKEYRGSIFYSDINLALGKRAPYRDFSTVCDELRKLGFLVHS